MVAPNDQPVVDNRRRESAGHNSFFMGYLTSQGPTDGPSKKESKNADLEKNSRLLSENQNTLTRSGRKVLVPSLIPSRKGKHNFILLSKLSLIIPSVRGAEPFKVQGKKTLKVEKKITIAWQNFRVDPRGYVWTKKSNK